MPIDLLRPVPSSFGRDWLRKSNTQFLSESQNRVRMGQVSPASSFVRLQFPDVFDDLVDLRIAERRVERRHRARLAVLDNGCGENRRLALYP